MSWEEDQIFLDYFNLFKTQGHTKKTVNLLFKDLEGALSAENLNTVIKPTQSLSDFY